MTTYSSSIDKNHYRTQEINLKDKEIELAILIITCH